MASLWAPMLFAAVWREVVQHSCGVSSRGKALEPGDSDFSIAWRLRPKVLTGKALLMGLR